jgi:hypothetical protein
MSALYDTGRVGLMDQSISWIEDGIAVGFCGPSYVPNLATDVSANDLPSGAMWVAKDLSGRYITANGAADADDLLVDDYAVVGKQLTRIVIFQTYPLGDLTLDSTSRLICVLDEGDGIGGITTGGPILIRWPDTPDYIFRI